MSPVITFGGLLGEATEGRIVSTKIGSGQALSSSEASVCVHLSHYSYFYPKSLPTAWLTCPKADFPRKVIAEENMGKPYEQEKMHS